MANAGEDPIIRVQRELIAGLDRQVLDALNRRIALVKGLKDYKEAHGFEFHDPAQEDRLLADLCRANPGPLSEEAVQAVFRTILEWIKRDASRP